MMIAKISPSSSPSISFVANTSGVSQGLCKIFTDGFVMNRELSAAGEKKKSRNPNSYKSDGILS